MQNKHGFAFSSLLSALLLAGVLVASCASPSAPTVSSPGLSMTVSWGAPARVLTPTYLTPLSYVITASDATGNGQTLTVDNSSSSPSSSVTFNNLNAESYTITVQGYNATGGASGGGAIIAQGSTTANLSSGTGLFSVALSYLPLGQGTGSVALTYNFAASNQTVSSATLTLVAPSGQVTTQNLTVANNAVTYKQSNLASGTWEVQLKALSTSETCLMTTAVVVGAGLTTTATIAPATTDFSTTPVPVQALLLSQTTTTLTVGQLQTLTAMLNAGATNTLVLWASSDPATVTVDAQGNIKALKSGPKTVIITASSAENPSIAATCVVNVPQAVLTAIAQVLINGNTYTGNQLVTVTGATSTQVDCKSVTPTTSPIATISNNQITATAGGSGAVTVVLDADPSISVTIPIEVQSTLTYSWNGIAVGSTELPPSETRTFSPGDTAVVQAPTLTEGPVIASWNPATNGGGTSYQPGQTFTFGNSNTTLYAQLTGTNWQAATTSPASHTWTSAVYGNGRFVAVASDGYTAVSLDGKNWQTSAQIPGINFTDVTYGTVSGSGIFVAVGYSGSTSTVPFAWSTDGQTWTVKTMTVTSAPVNSIDNLVAFGTGTFMAVFSGVSTPFYSMDGKTWTAGSSSLSSPTWLGLGYNSSLSYNSTLGNFEAFCGDGNIYPIPSTGAVGSSLWSTALGGKQSMFIFNGNTLYTAWGGPGSGFVGLALKGNTSSATTLIPSMSLGAYNYQVSSPNIVFNWSTNNTIEYSFDGLTFTTVTPTSSPFSVSGFTTSWNPNGWRNVPVTPWCYGNGIWVALQGGNAIWSY